MNDPATSYDQIPYNSLPFRQSHPNRLATVSTLMGLSPPPVASCRVLELGCGRGDNLLPLALELPDAELVGIDLSRRHVEMASDAMRELGIRNARIEQGDIAALPESLGRFDYVIAHGVYSWLPDAVREALMAACARHLHPEGIAYISYNTFPGWRQRGIARDAMMFHTRSVQDPLERIREAHRFIEFMGRVAPGQVPGYREMWQRLLDRIDSPEARDALVFHDFLEQHNEPVYFTQFAAHAGRYGLRYVAEARLSDSTPELLGAEVSERLATLGEDVVTREQYLDFITNRPFRQSLLCHADQPVQASPVPGGVARMSVSTELDADAGSGLPHDHSTMRFERGGVVVGMEQPLVKTALIGLRRLWPLSLPFERLLSEARAELRPGGLHAVPVAEWEAEPDRLAEELLELYRAGLVELDVAPPRFARRAGERPRGYAWAQRQRRAGELVCNLRHNGVELDPLAGELLLLADGSRDHAALARDLAAVMQQKSMALTDGDRRLGEGEESVAAVAARLPALLDKLVHLALLVDAAEEGR